MGIGFAPTWLRQVSPCFTKPLLPLSTDNLTRTQNTTNVN